MEKDIIEIIKSKNFFELDSSEKSELKEYCKNEDEFNQLKQAFFALEAAAFSSIKPSAKTKERLDDMFVQKYPQAAPIWYNSLAAIISPKNKPIYKQPLMQVAAVVALFFLAVPFFTSDLENDQLLVAENKIELTEKELVVDDAIENKENEIVSNLVEELNEQEESPLVIAQEELSNVSHTELLEFEDSEVTTATFANDDVTITSIATEPSSNHLDGVFIAMSAEKSIETISISVADSEDLMDLLVATF